MVKLGTASLLALMVATATAPAQPLTPEQSIAAMHLPAGFSATVFAAEPDVVQPIAYAIDDRGRLWVAEAYNYPKWKPTGTDRIVIFEDTDNDGHFDKRTVFYDKLNYVTGIEIGFGGAFVLSPPNLLFISDKNGDDKPDGEPEILLSGFVRLYQALDTAGQTVKLDIYEGMPHNFASRIPDAPESKLARKKIRDFVRFHLGEGHRSTARAAV